METVREVANFRYYIQSTVVLGTAKRFTGLSAALP